MIVPNSFEPPRRLLLGPGPSPVGPEVLAALARPTLGHLDPAFLGLMDEVRAMLRAVLETQNTLTVPMSGTGSAGMETAFVNIVEPGDSVVVGVHGVFGGRMAEVARRAGAKVTVVEAAWGSSLDADAMRAAAKATSAKVVALVHAETSTGVLTDLAPYRAIADETGALLLVDAVTSLGGVSVGVDRMGIDVIYSGTQKCLGCPPGLAPVSLSAAAEERLASRKNAVASWYLDLSLIRQYWGSERVYHHTAPINMLYGLHEALRQVLVEGLSAREARHRDAAAYLYEGLAALGLQPLVAAADRLPPLTTVKVPDDVDEAAVRRHMLTTSGIEIGGGLGPLKGRVWRIGLMGQGATRATVDRCLTALALALGRAVS